MEKALRILSILFLLVPMLGSAQPMAPVEALALYKDRVVLRTRDEQVMLKAGETSPGAIG